MYVRLVIIKEQIGKERDTYFIYQNTDCQMIKRITYIIGKTIYSSIDVKVFVHKKTFAASKIRLCYLFW